MCIEIDYPLLVWLRVILCFQALSCFEQMGAISQMPVILIPVHFDRDCVSRVPSCQHSVVLRPFCTHDFMTGTPALPGRDLPIEVNSHFFLLFLHLKMVLYTYFYVCVVFFNT